MVDVQMTNEKLVSRAQKIIMDATNVDKPTAKKYLDKYHSVKHAIFALMSNVEEIEEIDQILNTNKGNIRKSISSLKARI